MTSFLFCIFFLFLIMGVPIAISLGVASICPRLVGTHIPLLTLPQKLYNGVNSFPYMAIPLFLLAGNIMAEAKISERLVALAQLFVGRFPGGLAHVSTGACAFFGAISGAAPATTAAIGTIMIPSMEKRGYNKAFSAAVVAASGALGLIIPPSLTMVVFGVMSGASIGTLPAFKAAFPTSPFVNTGALGPTCNAHAPNEWLDLAYAEKLTCVFAELIAGIPSEN